MIRFHSKYALLEYDKIDLNEPLFIQSKKKIFKEGTTNYWLGRRYRIRRMSDHEFQVLIRDLLN